MRGSVSGVSKFMNYGIEFKTYRDSEARRHAVEVVGVLGHGRDLWHDRLARPLDAKDLCELLEVLRAGLTDAEDRVAEPGHAECAELLVEELDAQLACEQRDVLDDCQTHAPLLVLGELHNGR